MKLGFVGLGAMGSGMVRRLLAADHTVYGYNRTPAKAEPLIELGLQWRDSPREVAAEADVVFTMVTNVKALQAVTEGTEGILAGLAPGKVYVDMSTVSPTASRELAARVSELGAAMLDAPASGSLSTLEAGRRPPTVGGAEAARAPVAPIPRSNA